MIALLASCGFAITTHASSDQSLIQLAQAEGCPSGSTTVHVFYRYVGAGEVEAIQENHQIPMTDEAGDPKTLYFTDCLYSDARDAKRYLALRDKPTHRVEFKLRGNNARCGKTVAPKYKEPGGGNECTLNKNSAPIKIPDPAEAIGPLE